MSKTSVVALLQQAAKDTSLTPHEQHQLRTMAKAIKAMPSEFFADWVNATAAKGRVVVSDSENTNEGEFRSVRYVVQVVF